MIEEQLAFALRDEEELSVDLIEAQYALKNSKDKNNAKSLVILVSGSG
jgi:AMP-polyphosphate phosphotransferase